MPLRRTWACPECFYQWDVTLTLEQADDPPPPCERCAARTRQEFRPPAIVTAQGRVRDQANKLVEDIVGNDYGVGNIHRDRHEGATPKVRYKDQTPAQTSTWGVANAALEQAIANGREHRLKYGSGLDILQANIKSGAEPDLIANSKRRSIRVY